jgi:hypothetical protein
LPCSNHTESTASPHQPPGCQFSLPRAPPGTSSMSRLAPYIFILLLSDVSANPRQHSILYSQFSHRESVLPTMLYPISSSLTARKSHRR